LDRSRASTDPRLPPSASKPPAALAGELAAGATVSPTRKGGFGGRHPLEAPKNPELTAEGDSLRTMELEPTGPAVRLSITHTIEREPSKLIAAVSGGWPKIVSNLKSLLETGSIVLNDSGKK
jgi:hypothetical protein